MRINMKEYDKNINEFLESGLLENYLNGATTEEEAVQVEHYIAKYPEVKAAYDDLQDNLEQYARTFAISLPEGFKEEIIGNLGKNKRQRIPWFYVAASVIAVILCSVSIMLWSQNNLLSDQNNVVSTEMDDLREEVIKATNQFKDIKNQFDVLNNPETKKYVMRGNQRAKNLETVAYINPVEKLSMVNVVTLPDLPEEQVYQMWAEVDGNWVNLGILNNTNNELFKIPFEENASSYNITIEPKGGNIQATVENTVANIPLK